MPYGHGEEIAGPGPGRAVYHHRMASPGPSAESRGNSRHGAFSRSAWRNDRQDRGEYLRPGMSHALSTTNDLAEIRAFCEWGRCSVVRPASERPLAPLDLKLEPRERALSSPEVRVFERTSECSGS